MWRAPDGRIDRIDAWVIPIAAAERTLQPGRMPVRVLIVDDDTSFRRLIGQMLSERGYDVAGEAGTTAQARTAVRDLAPDALLLDVNLPDGSGLVFAQELASGGAAPRVLLTSSDPDAAPARRLAGSGATFVPKEALMSADLAPRIG
jgi:DNA-binding NarL/FixJ family response regulator